MLIQRLMNRLKHRNSPLLGNGLQQAASSEPGEWLRANGGRSSVKCADLELLSAFKGIIKLRIKHGNFMNSQYGMYSNAVVICLNNSVTDTYNNCRSIGSENINFRQNRRTSLKINVLIRWGLTYEIDTVCFVPARLFHWGYFFNSAINFDTSYKSTLSKTSCSCYLSIEGRGIFLPVLLVG